MVELFMQPGNTKFNMKVLRACHNDAFDHSVQCTSLPQLQLPIPMPSMVREVALF